MSQAQAQELVAKEPQESKKLSCRSKISLLHKVYIGKDFVDGDDKRALCKESPFFPLMVEKARKNNIELFTKVAELYDMTSNAFVINGRHMTLCAEEISCLMCLPCKGKEFKVHPASVLPMLYFNNLCLRYEKNVPKGAIAVGLIEDLLEHMEVKTESEKTDFQRVLNLLFVFVVTAKTQGTIPRGCVVFCESIKDFNDINWPRYIYQRIFKYLQQMHKKGKPGGKDKPNINCMVQPVEAWFNMRTGLITVEGIESASAPIFSYLQKGHCSSDDHVRSFEQIRPEKISNCINTECRNRELLLDHGNVKPFSYKCSTFLLRSLLNDYIGSYIKFLLTQSMDMLGNEKFDDASTVFINLIDYHRAVDNVNLFEILVCKGTELLRSKGANENDEPVANQSMCQLDQSVVQGSGSNQSMGDADSERDASDEQQLSELQTDVGEGELNPSKEETEAMNEELVEVLRGVENEPEKKQKNKKLRNLASESEGLLIKSGTKRTRKSVKVSEEEGKEKGKGKKLPPQNLKRKKKASS